MIIWALYVQQGQALSEGTDLRVRCVLGETDTTFWDPDQWAQKLLDHDVLVTTYQVLYNKLNKYLPGTRFRTLVHVRLEDVIVLLIFKQTQQP